MVSFIAFVSMYGQKHRNCSVIICNHGVSLLVCPTVGRAVVLLVQHAIRNMTKCPFLKHTEYRRRI